MNCYNFTLSFSSGTQLGEPSNSYSNLCFVENVFWFWTTYAYQSVYLCHIPSYPQEKVLLKIH